ncbi:MAG: Flp pilus assembly protein CpaB [Chloroflexi bacterium]|nr:Flp pilus assembly protein CpaB [Chloroflexota bacterium]
MLVLFGIGLAVLTFVLIIALLPGTNKNGIGGGPTASPVVNAQVVEALADIPLGTVVTKDMLTTATLPVTVAARDAYRDPSQVIGQTARRAILSGAQVKASDFALTQSSFVVPPGKRAMAISVTELTGVGKMIYPGDTVDVVITLDESVIKIVTVQPPAKSPYSHDELLRPVTVKAPLLLQDLQVIGTIDAPSEAAPASSAAPSQGPTLTGTNKLIVLAVTDAQAEAILFARTAGTIDLVLRAPADAGTTATTDGVILKSLFDKYGVLPPYLIKAIDAYIPQQP